MKKGTVSSREWGWPSPFNAPVHKSWRHQAWPSPAESTPRTIENAWEPLQCEHCLGNILCTQRIYIYIYSACTGDYRPIAHSRSTAQAVHIYLSIYTYTIHEYVYTIHIYIPTKGGEAAFQISFCAQRPQSLRRLRFSTCFILGGVQPPTLSTGLSHYWF